MFDRKNEMKKNREEEKIISAQSANGTRVSNIYRGIYTACRYKIHDSHCRSQKPQPNIFGDGAEIAMPFLRVCLTTFFCLILGVGFHLMCHNN
jgi:hypothetical protein